MREMPWDTPDGRSALEGRCTGRPGKVAGARCPRSLFWLLGLLLVSIPNSGRAADIQLIIGDLTVSSTALTADSCLQVPIFLRDPDAPRNLNDVTFTLEISGDTDILNGGVAADMLVANAMTSGDLTGIADPAVTLSNVNGSGAPACPQVFNQATEGQGPAASFFAGSQNGNWFINNELGAAGPKSGLVINLAGNSIGTTVAGQEMLLGVLALPVVSGAGPTQLQITATPNNVVAGANTYTWGSPLRVSPLDLSAGPGTIRIAQPPPVQLRIGSLVVHPSDISGLSCLQVPLFLHDPMVGRELFDTTVTVEISGDTDILDGGVAADMLVGNAFTSGNLTGLRNPGVNLSNANGSGAPTCPLVFNRVTQGSGAAVDFPLGNAVATWFINQNQGGVARNQGFVINILGFAIGSTAPGQDLLLGVLVLPVSANPGLSRLEITATPDAMVADGNVFAWMQGGMEVNEQLDLSAPRGVVEIADLIFADRFESGDLNAWQ